MDRNEIVKFGRWLKSNRQRLQKTQAQLAKELDVHVGTISAIEQGTIASLGRKLHARIEAYFNGSARSVQEEAPPEKTCQTVDRTQELVYKIASIICDPDFSKRVDGVKKYLQCDEMDAVVAILNNEIKKINT